MGGVWGGGGGECEKEREGWGDGGGELFQLFYHYCAIFATAVESVVINLPFYTHSSGSCLRLGHTFAVSHAVAIPGDDCQPFRFHVASFNLHTTPVLWKHGIGSRVAVSRVCGSACFVRTACSPKLQLVIN